MSIDTPSTSGAGNDRRTRVYLTFDVECAEERLRRGRRQPALGYEARVWGRFVNQKRELGVRLIMDMLEAHGCRATFFLEPFGSRWFGEESFLSICRELRSRGHDVQLHLHPTQRRALWLSRGESRLPDDMWAYTEDEQVALLSEGIALLEAAGVPRSEIHAFRAGNYGGDTSTWRALARAGLALDSSFNPGYFSRNCRLRFEHALPDLFETPVAGLYELPITCLQQGSSRAPRYRHLQITAISTAEMIDALRQSRQLGMGEVTIVSHSFEFAFIDTPTGPRGRPNQINLARLRKLLTFLTDEREAFAVETVGELAARLETGARTAPVTPAGDRRYQRVRPWLRLLRQVEQARKRWNAVAVWQP